MSAPKQPLKGEAMKGKSIIYASALTVAAILTTVLMAGTYQRDAKFESFINDFDTLADEVVDEISDNPNLAGVVAAQEILDAKKADLRQRLVELKTLHSSRVSGQTMLQFQERLNRNAAKISQLLDNKALKQAARKDPVLRQRVKNLHDDYMSIIGERVAR